MITILGYTCTALVILGFYLNANKHIICFPIWVVADLGWVAYSFITGTPEHAIQCGCLIAINLYGWYNWKTTATDETEEVNGLFETLPKDTFDVNQLPLSGYGIHRPQKKKDVEKQQKALLDHLNRSMTSYVDSWTNDNRTEGKPRPDGGYNWVDNEPTSDKPTPGNEKDFSWE